MKQVERWQDIEPGDLGYLRGTGFVSESIEHLTDRLDLMGFPTPSHAVLVLSKTQIIEALSRTKVRPLAVYQGRFLAGDFVVFRPDVPAAIRRQALDEIWRKYNGAAYGWGQILGFLPVIAVRRLTGKDAVNLLPLGTICSELTLLYLRRCYDLLHVAGDLARAARLAWAWHLQQNTTDPALQLACVLRDTLPPTLDGSRP